eukprot:2843426-Lingulodinium_polyedra.AAC.1
MNSQSQWPAISVDVDCRRLRRDARANPHGGPEEGSHNLAIGSPTQTKRISAIAFGLPGIH